MTKTPIRILVGLMLCAAAAPLVAADGFGAQMTPCEKPGRDQLYARSEDVVLPTGGYYWTESGGVDTAGETRHASVYTYNYNQVPGSCVGAFEVAVEPGTPKSCPAPGPGPLLGSAWVDVYDGSHWENGQYYLDGHRETFTIRGQNDQVAGRCAGTAAVGHTSAPLSWCVTCVSNDDGDATLKLLP